MSLDVSPAEAGERLDRFLAARLPELSRSRLKALTEAGHVRVGGRTIVEAKYRVKPGEAVELDLPEPEPWPESVLREAVDTAHDGLTRST